MLIPELQNYCLKKKKVYEFHRGRFKTHENMEGAMIQSTSICRSRGGYLIFFVVGMCRWEV